MKTRRSIAVIMLGSFLTTGFQSCRREGDSLTNEEAADVIENMLVSNSGGLAAQTEDVIMALDDAENKNQEATACDVLYDTTVTRIGSYGSVSFDYTFNWNYILTCSNLNVPQSFDFNYTSDGVYDTQRMSSDDNGSVDFTVTGIQPSAQNYVFNGMYLRNGTQQSKVRNQNSFSSTIQLTLNDVTVDKSTYAIIGGSASVSISGEVDGGESFAFEGTIVFGNGTGTITLEGETYSVDL